VKTLTDIMNDNPEREQWETHETARLNARRCPHSGLPLRPDHHFGLLLCAICDCHGYGMGDNRIGEKLGEL